MAEARQTEVLSHEDRMLDMAKMSVNNSYENSKVTLPNQINNEQESGLSIRRTEWNEIHNQVYATTKSGR